MHRAPPLTFAHFLGLPENRAALEAVRQVASCLCSRNPTRSVNPLYLHGPAGSGKTHLISALADEVTRAVPEVVITLLPAGDFAAQAGASEDLRAEAADALRAARGSDLLVIDD